MLARSTVSHPVVVAGCPAAKLVFIALSWAAVSVNGMKMSVLGRGP